MRVIRIAALALWLGTLSAGGGISASAWCRASDTGPDPCDPDRYDVVWDSPSADAAGTMPLGNGDIGLNTWVDPTGDILFYISKTDAWGDNGRLLKVGRIRIRLEPSPLTPGQPFRQTLALGKGMLLVQYGEAETGTTVRLWVDANHPVVQLDVESKQPVSATASIELWRTEQQELSAIEVSDVMLDRSAPSGSRAPTVVEPDTILTGVPDQIGWYHHNVKSVGPAITGPIQGLTGFPRQDPLLHRTFGGVVRAEQAQRLDDLRLQSPRGTKHRFEVFVLTRHPATPAQWLDAMQQTIATTDQVAFARRLQAHLDWWTAFWSRSWIHVSRSATAEDEPFIPTNDYRVKIGSDRAGGSRFQGTIGRVSLFQDVLDADAIDKLAGGKPADPVTVRKSLIGSWSEYPVDGLEPLEADLTRSLTIEAWIRPAAESGTSGRIVDRIMPGGADGFLLDTWPGNSLRLIVGREIVTAADCLKAGTWQHVAAVIDARQRSCRLWLDGQPIAGREIHGDDATVVSGAYARQRFMDACAGRGPFPIKFNGSIFTVPYPDQPGDADYRRWGPGYWWQNTRLPYISMCSSGDFEMMLPLFRMYARDLLPLMTYRTHHYFGHDGAFFPECIYFWGDVFSDTYGWTPFEERGTDKLQSSGWHKWEWVCGPELVWMMLDYYDHTQDAEFLHETLLPAAHEVLVFFDQHYELDGDGKLVMHPAQALETWWDCTNPMPELAGLYGVTERLLSLPVQQTSAEQRAFWTRLRAKLPPLPTREVEGVRMLAPATQFASKRNIENPELYAVFPFRLVAIGRPDIEYGIEALKHRWDRGDFGWRQDDIFMAYLGLTEDAQRALADRARRYDSRSRFPAFWGPNYDWVPDQDHGGVLMKALQAMALQTDGDKIYLLPAWPSDWDVSFKLHAPRRTVIQMVVKGGRVESLQVEPAARRQDVILGPGY